MESHVEENRIKSVGRIPRRLKLLSRSKSSACSVAMDWDADTMESDSSPSDLPVMTMKQTAARNRRRMILACTRLAGIEDIFMAATGVEKRGLGTTWILDLGGKRLRFRRWTMR